MSQSHRSSRVVGLAVVLGLCSVGFAYRAWQATDARARLPSGAYGHELAPAARAVVAQLARGLLRHQRADGAIEAGPDWAFGFEVERVANTALCAAALADALQVCPAGEVEGLEEGIQRALSFLVDRQGSTGPIGERHPKDVWSQVEATASGIYAAATVASPQGQALLARAGPALARMAQGGIRNGWTRAVALLAVDRVLDRRQEAVFGRPFRDLVDRRDANEAPGLEGRLRATDWNLTEAIARTLLQVRAGADGFPARMVEAVLEDLPIWRGQGSDTKSWWLAAWIAARSGQGRPWFARLLETAQQEVLWVQELAPASFYTCATAQTAGLLLALAEGFRG